MCILLAMVPSKPRAQDSETVICKRHVRLSQSPTSSHAQTHCISVVCGNKRRIQELKVKEHAFLLGGVYRGGGAMSGTSKSVYLVRRFVSSLLFAELDRPNEPDKPDSRHAPRNGS